jgi:hypothetical protein
MEPRIVTGYIQPITAEAVLKHLTPQPTGLVEHFVDQFICKRWCTAKTIPAWSQIANMLHGAAMITPELDDLRDLGFLRDLAWQRVEELHHV